MYYILYIGLAIFLIWELVALPLYVKKKIITSIDAKGAHFLDLKLVTKRDAIFYVTYQENGISKNSHVKYNLFGHLTWL
jgi:hypothetical protein